MLNLNKSELINIHYRMDIMGYNSDIDILEVIISEINNEISKREELTITLEKGSPEIDGWNLLVKDLVNIQDKLNKLGYGADLEVIEDVLICASEIGGNN